MIKSQRQLSSVLSSSKKIKKPSESKKKKYKTFTVNIRNAILSSLKETILTRELVSSEETLNVPTDFLRLVDHMDLNLLNSILQEILKKHIMSFRPDVKSLRKWRRKIKEWIMTCDKPDGRGHVFIPRDNIVEFTEHLIPELLKMPTRNFDLLKRKVYKVFTILGLVIPVKSCSKHWWYSFMEKNAEVKGIWEALPKRAKRKQVNLHLMESEEEEEEGSTKIEEEFPLKEEDRPFEVKIEIKLEMKTEVKEESDSMMSIKEEEENLKMMIKEEEKMNIKEEERNENPKEKIPLFLPYFTFNPLPFYDEKRVEKFTPWAETRTSVKQENI